MHSQAVVARLLAQVAALRAELTRTQHELRLWQAQLNLAQKEILRAQQVVDEVDRARADAEERSHRYRQSLRRLLDERAVQLARDEGRHRGYHEGFQFAAAHPPVPIPPEQIRPHTNPRLPRMTLPERIADEWRSQNQDVRPVSSSGFRRPNEPLPQRPATTAPRVWSKHSTPNIAVESPSIPPSNNTERTVVDLGLLSPNQSYQPHRPVKPTPSSSSFASKQQDHVPSSSSFASKQQDPQPIPSSSSFSSSRQQHQVYPPAFIPLSPIPALSSLAAIPETTSYTSSPHSHSATTSYPNSLSSSVPVPGASSVDSRDV